MRSQKAMIEIYRNRDSSTVGTLQSLLESEGIRTYLRNEHVSGTTVAIPEVYPALCVLEEADVERGVELIRGYIEEPRDESGPELTCPKCGEKSPGTFDACWNCGAQIGDLKV
ncbi:MAG: hypothetical protein EOP85_20735 [Verrucomicrobiaceae bacterium]|nr:MAG: hypothetical protein EOP85_20735 [Verrucomicrobiaceae bacterium]